MATAVGLGATSPIVAAQDDPDNAPEDPAGANGEEEDGTAPRTAQYQRPVGPSKEHAPIWPVKATKPNPRPARDGRDSRALAMTAVLPTTPSPLPPRRPRRRRRTFRRLEQPTDPPRSSPGTSRDTPRSPTGTNALRGGTPRPRAGRPRGGSRNERSSTHRGGTPQPRAGSRNGHTGPYIGTHIGNERAHRADGTTGSGRAGRARRHPQSAPCVKTFPATLTVFRALR